MDSASEVLTPPVTGCLKSRFFYHILNLILLEYISKEKNTEMFVDPEKIIAEEAKASVTDA